MVIDNGPGLAVRSDINAAILALASQNSGPIEPATKYAGMIWLDTSVVPNGQLRQRNQANTAWVDMLVGTAITQPATDNDTSIATTAYVKAQNSTLSTDAVTDWDSITTPGFSSLLLGSGNAHAPEASGFFFCQVLLAASNLTQIAYPYGHATAGIDKGIWYRGRYGGTWGAWRNVQASTPGMINWFATSNPPIGYLKANGAGLAPGTYPALFAVIGYLYGGSGGTFLLPDLRGEFIRGFDDARGVDAGRTIGSAQSDLVKAHTHNITTVSATTGGSSSGVLRSSVGTGLASVAFGEANVGAENRPRNIALLGCIRYQ
jgi:microcystin-dependent protein